MRRSDNQGAKKRRGVCEHHTAGMLFGGGQLPELFPGGGTAAADPAGGEPSDQKSGGRAGGEAVHPHQQERASDPGGPPVPPVRPGHP